MSREIVFDTNAIGRLEQTFWAMEEFPPSIATKAASKGMTIVRREVRKTVPVGKTGQLKRGLRRFGERSKIYGRKFYQLTFPRSMNSVFQKPIKYTGIYGGYHLDHAYYPNSVEYGFLARTKNAGVVYREFNRKSSKYRNSRGHRGTVKIGVHGRESKKVKGQHYMLKGAQNAESQAIKATIDTAIKELDRIWGKN